MERWKQLIVNLAAVIFWIENGDSEDGVQDGESSVPSPTEFSIEMEVLGFRLWMIIAFVIVGILVIMIVCCCVFDCRIPRTKQEIEAEQKKKMGTRASRSSKTEEMLKRNAQLWAMQRQSQELNFTNIAGPSRVQGASGSRQVVHTNGQPGNFIGQPKRRPGERATARTLHQINGQAYPRI